MLPILSHNWQYSVTEASKHTGRTYYAQLTAVQERGCRKYGQKLGQLKSAQFCIRLNDISDFAEVEAIAMRR
jgi:hypothetical protein